tara:strand:+ start:651 stop:1487 length:837 start_codon:yes stop_codon:yes gene_type:complete
MLIKSYSKINLTLKVTSKLKNGFHEIQSLYCLINLSDDLKIKKITKKQDKISFVGPFKKHIKDNDNSVYNLLKKLRKINLISNNYSITIKKNIPVFGGLGGGTSNAAFILKYLLKKKINNNLLSKLENVVGTDLKLFFKNYGFLENLKTIIKLKNRPKFYFILIKPNINCSTKDIYSSVKKFSKKEKLYKGAFKSERGFLEYLSKDKNDLQLIVEKKYPIIKKLLIDIKSERGCCFSRLTGSGSVCYGLFKDQITAKKALNNLKKKHPKFWLSLAKTV